MPKVVVIGDGLGNYADSLSSTGYSTLRFKSAKPALGKINGSSLIVIDGRHAEALGELSKASRHIPKLVVVSPEKPAKSLGRWLRTPLSYPICRPSERELLSFAARILRERDSCNEKERLTGELGVLRKEIEFFEEINRMLTSSQDLNKTLVTIMKRLREVTRAEAWSIYLVDDLTGALVLEKTGGRVSKGGKPLKLSPDEVAGWVASNGEPVVVGNVSRDKRFSSTAPMLKRMGVKSIMCAPVRVKDRVLGVLEVINKAGGEGFDEEDFHRMMRLVGQAALAVERIMLYQKAEELVVTDDLTKLFNSRYLNSTIETEIIRSKRFHVSVSLIFMDIDYFKYVNDNYGHLVGSKVLIEAGQVLVNTLRRIDVVARYGGDEFVIVLPQTGPHNAKMLAEKLRKRLENHLFLEKDGYNIRITASFGVASYPESAKTKEDLLRLADEAMYWVKHHNRNGVYAFV
jgi:diguanylate cyclase (GGDEF)-like protein